MVDGTGLEQGGSDDASRQSKQSAQWAVAWPAVPRELGTSTGMTAVQSLSFAQRKSEQNKIVIAKAGYHRGDGILPFATYA